MPGYLRLSCTACGRPPSVRCLDGTAETSGFVADGSLSYYSDDGRFVTLPHPAEWSTLIRLGTDAERASREGRLLEVEPHVCTDCGVWFELSALSELGRGGSGSIAALALSILAPVGLFVVWLVWRSLPLAVLVGGVLLVAGAAVLLRTRSATKPEEPPSSPVPAHFLARVCPDCHSSAIKPLRRLSDTKVPCLHCHRQAVSAAWTQVTS